MIPLLAAIIAASLLGSLHCVGMCGPLAILAVGNTSHSNSSLNSSAQGWQLRLAAYHVGRLFTYACMGVAVGGLGLAVDSSTSALGYAGMAARVAGGALILVGCWRLLLLWLPQHAPKLPTASPLIARWLSSMRQPVAKLPPTVRAMTIGALTTLLPCGWLYVFALVASGTGHPLPAVLIMTAFWIGTLPALTALVTGFARIGSRMGRQLPVLIGLMLIGTGWYTATGRAAADLAPLTAKAAWLRATSTSATPAELPTKLTAALETLKQEPLPCCLPKAPHE